MKILRFTYRHIILTIAISFGVISCSTVEEEPVPLRLSEKKQLENITVKALDTSKVDFMIDHDYLMKMIHPDKHQSHHISPPSEIPKQYIHSRLALNNTSFICQEIDSFSNYKVIQVQMDNNHKIWNYYFSYDKNMKLIDVKSILLSCLDCDSWDHFSVVTNGTSKEWFEINVNYYDTLSQKSDIHPDQMKALKSEKIYTNRFGRFTIR